jgi:predicted phage tail protein
VSADPANATLHSWKPADVSGGAVSVIDTSDEAVLFGGSLQDLDGVDVGAVLYPEESRRTAPRAPTTPEVSVNGSSVHVTWSRPPLGSTPASYVVEGGSAQGRSDLANFSTGSTDTGFAADVAGGTYYLRMRSANAFGLSGASEEFAFTVGASTCAAPPLPPLDLRAEVTGSDVALSWRASPRSVVTRYVLRAGDRSGTSNIASLDVGTATSVDVSASPGAFFITLIAVNECGTSVPSEETVAVVGGAPVPPGHPFNLEAAITGSTVVLSWGAPSVGTGPFQYVVEVGSAPRLSDILVTPTGAHSLSATAVPPGVYYVRTRAVGVAGIGPVSNEVAVVVR